MKTPFGRSRRTKEGFGKSGRRLSGRFGGFVFGLFFAAISGVITVAFASDMLVPYLEALPWEETTAVVVVSDFDPDTRETSFSYRYSIEGREFTGSEMTPGGTISDLREKQRFLAERPVGASITIFFDPEEPSRSTATREFPTEAFIILFPAGFFFIGVAIALTSLLVTRGKTGKKQGFRTGRKSKLARAVGPRLVALAVCVIAGLLGWFLGFRVILAAAEADNWASVPCTIVDSQVASHTDSDGTTYSAQIRYRYTFEERDYLSERVSFFDASTSNQSGARKTVREFAKGSQATCFVDPEDPTSAVLRKEAGLLPKILGPAAGLVSLAALVFVVRGLPRKGSGVARTESGPAAAHLPTNGLELKPTSKRLTVFLATCLFALVWNGIILTIFFAWLRDYRNGSESIGPGVFLGLFLLIGAGAVLFALYGFLSLFNPKTTLRATPREGTSLVTGKPFRLEWSVEGNTRRLRDYALYLEGLERATYRRGTDTVTKENVFYQEALFETSGSPDPTGTTDHTIPLSFPPSFDADNNKILWRIVVRGTIARWPDVRDSHTFPVS